jgi:hypothetical protein
MFGDRGSRWPRSLNRHRSLIGPSCAFLFKIECPIDRTQLRVFSQRATPEVLLSISEAGAIIEGSGSFWKNTEVTNACPADRESRSMCSSRGAKSRSVSRRKRLIEICGQHGPKRSIQGTMLRALGEIVKKAFPVGNAPAALSTPPEGEPMTVSCPPFGNVVLVAFVTSVTELVDAE